MGSDVPLVRRSVGSDAPPIQRPMRSEVPLIRRLSLCGAATPLRNEVSGAQRGRERHAAPPTDAHGGRLAARAHPPRPHAPPRPADAMDLADVPRHRPLAFDRMESLIKEMQDPETGVRVRSQKLFLTVIPSAFMGYDLVEWLMDRFNLDETGNGECLVIGGGAWVRRRNPIDSSYNEKSYPQSLIFEAMNLANQLCQYGYFFPVNDSKNLILKDDSSLYRFQSPYYWPWQAPRVAGSGSSAPTLGPDNVEYAIYLVKRTLRNKQRHGLEDYEQEALTNLKKNLAAKWDFITMQAEEQVRLAKERKKGDKIVSDSQERAYWRVARPPPGVTSALEPCPVPVRARHLRPRRRTHQQLMREIELLKSSLDRVRVKTSIALEALVAYSETFTPYDPWLTPPQPSNPWVSDDTLFWQINNPLVEVPSEKRVQRWAISIEELVSDPTGLQEFTSFLRKEYSHENIRFWLAVMDLRRSSTKQIPQKLKEIYEEFLKPGAPCEINIDGATAERVMEGMKSGSRYALDHAADHVYSLLLKKDCYPRFIRSDHFQRLLTEGRNVHQKKAKFFNFGGQVKKKVGACGAAGAGGALARRRGSDRSLSGSAHELAVCAAHPPRPPDPPPHSHSQSNLADIPFRDPIDDDTADVLPWENASRDGVYGSTARRRQDSVADSGSSSSDVSATAERRRLPQQSTLDGGLRGAPPPLRRLSAVEPRHLAPLSSPPHSPRILRPTPPTVHPPIAPPHPTPTISVSSAPDDESPEETRSEEPSSVFATPTDPIQPLIQDTDNTERVTVRKLHSREDSIASATVSDSRDSERTTSDEEVASVRGTLSREPSTMNETSPASSKDISSKISELPDSPREVAGDVIGTFSSEQIEVKLDIGVATIPVTATVETEQVKGKESYLPVAGDRTSPKQSSPTSKLIEDSRVSHAHDKKTEGPRVLVESLQPETSPAPAGTCRSAKTRGSLEASHGSASVDISGDISRITGTHSGLKDAMPVVIAAGGQRVIPRVPVAPLAEGEDIGVDDDHVDKVPSAPLQRVLMPAKAASITDATKNIAHKDGLSSVTESKIVKRDTNTTGIGERKQRNDICPWEDE